MLTIQIRAVYPGRWKKQRTATWRRSLPESWEEIPEKRRGRYFEALVSNEGNGVRFVLRQLLRLPAWALRGMDADQVGMLAAALSWMLPRPDCVRIPFPSFRHRGVTYHLPAIKGQNMCCLEYPIADDYYLKFYNSGDPAAILCLVGVLCREEHPDPARALSTGDKRVPLLSRTEAEARADRLKGLEPYLQFAVLLYFAGLKAYIFKTYKSWIFEEDEEDDEEEEEEEIPEEDRGADEEEDEPEQEAAANGPDFGWWGIYQEAAEAGLFGTLEQVYQTSFHDVAMWLVRQRVKAEVNRPYIRNKEREYDNL